MHTDIKEYCLDQWRDIVHNKQPQLRECNGQSDGVCLTGSAKQTGAVAVGNKNDSINTLSRTSTSPCGLSLMMALSVCQGKSKNRTSVYNNTLLYCPLGLW